MVFYSAISGIKDGIYSDSLNCNTLLTTGTYYGASITNGPVSGMTYAQIEVFKASLGVWTVQLCFNILGDVNNCYYRIYNNGTWRSWQRVGLAPTMVFLSNSQTRSTSFAELNDMKVFIPAGCFYLATLRLFYEYSSVAEIGIGNYSSTSIEDGCQVRKVNSSAYGYVHNPSVTFSSYATSDLNVMGYGRWSSATSNRAQMFVMRWPSGSFII